MSAYKSRLNKIFSSGTTDTGSHLDASTQGARPAASTAGTLSASNPVAGSARTTHNESQYHPPTTAIHSSGRRRDAIGNVTRQLNRAIKQQGGSTSSPPDVPPKPNVHLQPDDDASPEHDWPEPTLKVLETQEDGALLEICNHEDYGDLQFILDWGTGERDLPILLFDLDGNGGFADSMDLPSDLY